ncbi:HNH endonuclease signature motif containing protein [Corynebacterium sp. L4756]|uniref:HNH endonuclease signature motif containing protein n=1 Tax=unclassified Corynebacterium TaxID=2624378 RepID=UPI00374CAC37
MELLAAFTYVNSQGMALLRLFSSQSPYDLTRLGMELKTAKSIINASTAYFGPTDSPRKQQDAVELATSRGLSLEHLLVIEFYARKLKSYRGQAWKLRVELLAHEGGIDEIRKLGLARVDELKPAKPPTAGVRVGTTRMGMRTMVITDSERKITDLEKSLDALADPEAPRPQGLLDALWQRMERGGRFEPKYSTVIAIGLDDFAKINAGLADDVTVGLSDGSTMSGQELVNAALAGALGDDIYAGLFHPTQGPVNLYEARFASFKHRLLAKAENLVCPWPDCNVPADRCQIHHIDAHKHGGHTTPANLTTLCRYHNGVNDDDQRGQGRAGHKSRGRMRRHRGKVRYTSPGGHTFGNTHQVSDLGAMDLIN